MEDHILKYKAVVTDLDGTLLNPQGQLSTHTLVILKKLSALGITLVFATGRHPRDAQRIAQALEQRPHIVGLNGSLTLCQQSDAILCEHVIAQDIIADIMRFIAPYHIHLSAFDSHGWKLYEVNEMANDYVKLSGFSYLQIAPSDIFSLKINKLLLWSPNDIAPLEQRLQQQFGQYLACYRTSAQQLEIGPRGISKASAVAALLAEKGIDFQRQAIAFGDGHNDTEMLRQAGLGIVMDNAPCELKMQLGTLPVAQSNADDGVAQMLQHIFKI
ncbi:HAD family hydrolase [Edwardsiella piscicida]|uniref:HAD family hydrolase n=1 Tax=Edwardsiella piscicida TaxID=1263550 RepID=UPI00370D8DA2